jgi:hypothetical protein
MSIYLVNPKNIPDNIYIAKPEKGDWKYIHQFVFENGFEYYFGSNHLIDDFNEIIQNIKFDYYIVKNSNNASELQQIYNNEYNIFINYSDCIKIWKYYTKHTYKIQKILSFC